MPKLVRHESLESQRRCGPVEARSAEHPVAQHSPGPKASEDEIVGSPVRYLLAQILSDEARDGNRSALVPLGDAPSQHSVDLNDRLGDLDPAPTKVDPLHLQGGQLAPAQPAVGEDEHDDAVGGHDLPLAVRESGTSPETTCLVREAVDLGMREVPPPSLLDSGQVDLLARVPGKPSVPHGEIEDEAEDSEVLADRSGGGTFRVLLRHPRLDVGVRHSHELSGGPVGQDMQVEDASVPGPRRGLELSL